MNAVVFASCCSECNIAVIAATMSEDDATSPAINVFVSSVSANAEVRKYNAYICCLRQLCLLAKWHCITKDCVLGYVRYAQSPDIIHGV